MTKTKSKRHSQQPLRLMILLCGVIVVLLIGLLLRSKIQTSPVPAPTSAQSVVPTPAPTLSGIELLQTIKLPDNMRAIAYSPTDDTVAVLLDNQILLGNFVYNNLRFRQSLTTRQDLSRFGRMTGLAFSPDGRIVMTGAVLSDGDTVVLRWNTITHDEQPYRTIKDRDREPIPPWHVVDFSGHGDQGTMITSNLDAASRTHSVLHHFDLHSGEIIDVVLPDDDVTLHRTDPTDIALAENTFAVQLFGNPAMRYSGGRIVIQRDDGETVTIIPPGHDGLHHMTLSPDGAYLAGTSYDYRQPTDDDPDYQWDFLHIWLGDELLHSRPLQRPLLDIVFASDSRYLIMAERIPIPDDGERTAGSEQIFISVLDGKQGVTVQPFAVPMDIVTRFTTERVHYAFSMHVNPAGDNLWVRVDDTLFRYALNL